MRKVFFAVIMFSGVFAVSSRAPLGQQSFADNGGSGPTA